MKFKLYIANPAGYLTDKKLGMVNVMAYQSDYKLGLNWLEIGEVDVNIDEEAVFSAAVEQIDQTEANLLAEYQNRLTELQRAKQELLSIEHNPKLCG